MAKPRIALDWDGTLVQNQWPHQSRIWMPGAVEAIHRLSEDFSLTVHTSRIAPMMPDEITERHAHEIAAEINYIRDLLDSAGLTMMDIHTQPWKPGAMAYVDDRAVHYAGRQNSWANIVPKLLAMKELV